MRVRKDFKGVGIEMEVCDRCTIGIGVTKYPDGDFEHETDRTYKVLTRGGYQDLCLDCRRRYEIHKS